MKKKNIIILVIVLAALIVLYMAVGWMNKVREKKEQEQEKSQQVQAVSFDPDQVVSFSWQSDGNTVLLEKQDESWICESAPDEDLDEDVVNTMLKTLGNISTEHVVENPSDTDQYGIDSPVQTVKIKFEDGSTTELLFGDQNEISGGYYMQVSGDQNIYLVDESIVTETLSYSVDDLKAVSVDDDSSSDEEQTQQDSSEES